MKEFTKIEENLINSLNKPIDNIDMNIVNSIVSKMLDNREYYKLICFLNNLYDFAKVPSNIVDKLILDNNKECIAEFLNNEDILYFLSEEEKNKFKDFLNVCEVNIKLENNYDYYYKLLYKQGIRSWHSNIDKVSENVTEYKLTKYNQLIKIKLKDIKNVGLVVSCTIYSNYCLTKEEQILKGIDYINEFGFNIDRNINNKAIIKKINLF